MCPEIPPPPSISYLGGCSAYFEASATESEVTIYLSACVPIGGFQFSLEFNGIPVEEDIIPAGGAAGLYVSMTGTSGLVVGHVTSGSSPITAGTAT